MTDQTPQTQPDNLDWHESGIIVKAVAVIGTALTGFIVSVLAAFGFDISSPEQAKIGAAVASFLALCAAVGIIYNRYHQNCCPPINPILTAKPKEN
jgi:hypothetical protein